MEHTQGPCDLKVTKKWKVTSSAQVVDGSKIECKGSSDMKLAVLRLQVIVINHVVDGTAMVMGMDVMGHFGGVSVGGDIILFGGGSSTVSQECDQEQSSVRSYTAYTNESKDFRVVLNGW